MGIIIRGRTGVRLFLVGAPEKTKIREMETRFVSRRLIFSGGEPVLPHEPWGNSGAGEREMKRRGEGDNNSRGESSVS